MGKFIEGLRHKAQQGIVGVQKEVEAILKAGRRQQFERERISRERSENMPQWEEAKRQFNESGLLAIFKKVIDLKGAESYFIDPESFHEMLYWNFDVGSPYFYAELHIETTVKEHDEHYYVGGYSNKITTKYIGIRTDKTGVIEFRGKGPFGQSKLVRVSKVKWQENVGVLEDALGKVYHRPLVAERSEMIDNPVFDRHFGSFKQRFENEYKDPGV